MEERGFLNIDCSPGLKRYRLDVDAIAAEFLDTIVFGIYFVINKITIFCNTIYSYHPGALCKVFNVAQFSKILQKSRHPQMQ